MLNPAVNVFIVSVGMVRTKHTAEVESLSGEDRENCTRRLGHVRYFSVQVI